ncbi:MAG: AAA family ATPase [Deltaproteobacteria bacterium]|nr:AAA family ATPase [Deltaproteobacteria bacterium]
MLVSFTFENHRSFRDEAELSFVPAKALRQPDYGVTLRQGADTAVLTVAGLFGANASGKSNVLDALHFLRNAVVHSHVRWSPDGPIPRRAFVLDERSGGNPSTYQVDLVLDGLPVQYGFSVDDEQVLREWIYVWPAGKRRIWLERTGPESFRFGRTLKGPNRSIANLTRPNSLFLSAAVQNNHQQLQPLARYLHRMVFPVTRRDEAVRAFYTMNMVEKDSKRKRLIVDLMCEADLGISDVQIRKGPEGLPAELGEAVVQLDRSLAYSGVPPADKGAIEDIRRLILYHKGPGRRSVPLEIWDESAGTLSWFALVGPMVEVLTRGGLLVVDELNAQLHELLQSHLIHRFNNPETNPNGGQLLFTSQDSTLLGSMVEGTGLRRDQVWFTSKERDGSSRLTALTEFRVRRGENIQRRYLEGRFGAVPYVDGLERLRFPGTGTSRRGTRVG